MVPGRKEAAPLSGCTVEIPVRFAECDPYGVVWHGHYGLYLEQAREAMTRQFGFTAARSLDLGYRVPITRMEVRYRRPILADTSVRVTARLRLPEAARLVVDYEIRDAAGELLAAAETEQVIVKEDGELFLTLPGVIADLARKILASQSGVSASAPGADTGSPGSRTP